MKKDQLFGRVSDEEAARIADEYPTGDIKHRDRIFREIERRVEDTSASVDEVSGVESYRSRIWGKVLSAAAVFVLVAGAAAGGGYLLLRNGRAGVPVAEFSEISSSVTEVETTEEDTTEEDTTEEQLTKEDLIAKIKNRDYDAYDQLSIKYHTTVNCGASCEHSEARRDRITGNESLIKVWTHTAEYYKDLDDEIIAESGGIDKLAETITKNEMFMYKDLYICVYSDTSSPGPDQYEAFDRSRCDFDKPNIFCDLYSEYIINDDLDNFEVQDITTNVEFIGRDCTQLVMTSDYVLPPAYKDAPITDPSPAQDVTGQGVQKQTLTLTVDNETGFILAAKLVYGENYEEFTVEEILFNEDAALPEDAGYIKNRIAGCIPNCEETAAYDLSQLDE
ncbi:hypothetical protein [Ruminococcus flavefaciens]|uniref:hypothetical protein n=1 Tax=Ruminococcus flavefaciens TaxID=1265 RepID=UPI00030FD655|nr:hypothetical protein [Ruminococcus flavefaciens]